MKIDQVRELIPHFYEADKSSVLLLGSPGIGKSTGVSEGARDIAKKLNREFVEYDDTRAPEILAHPERFFLLVDFRLTGTEPSDLQGFPKEIDVPGIVGGAVVYKPLLWAVCLSKTAGILLVDELTNIQRLDVISAAYQIVLDLKSGFTRFSDNVMVIAAGNMPDESTVANLLPAPLTNRFTRYTIECSTVEKWAEWMDQNIENWDRRTLGYLMQFRDHFLKLPNEAETLENFPTPRAWTKMARLGLRLPEKFFLETAIGSVGEGVGREYAAFCSIDIPTPQEFIENPDLFRQIGTQRRGADSRYLASVMIGTYLGTRPTGETESNILREMEKRAEKAVPLLRVITKTHAEFLVLACLSFGKDRIHVAKPMIKDKEIRDVLVSLGYFQNELEMI